jgi:adenine-specific DNA-methyltransferase
MVEKVMDDEFTPEMILEPSAGDGRFVKELQEYGGKVFAIEINKNKVRKMKDMVNENTNIYCRDFIRYSLVTNEKFDLVIGNPPYINKKNLSEKDKIKSQKLVDYWNLQGSIFQNLWVSFVLGSLKLLSPEKGRIFFVLPFEFLQSKYAEKLRAFLEQKFNTIEIITFEEKIFSDIDQDVCLVLLKNIPTNQPSIKYITLNNTDEFKEISNNEIRRDKPLIKWSNAILANDELILIERITSGFVSISDIGFVFPGIVTGSNKFFIINNNKKEEMNCSEYVLPIIEKSNYIQNMILYNKNDFNNLIIRNKPVWLLNLQGVEENELSPKMVEYLSEGEDRELVKRYKCSIRKRWFEVPNIKKGDILFFRRYNRLPKLVVNTANVYSTDVSYNIKVFSGFDPLSVVFCFYNSITITMCEYNGRFYGGGVCELVPSEFKSIKIPYKKIDISDVHKLDSMFRNNASIDEILDYVDEVTLSHCDFSELSRIREIRNKYLSRRLFRIQ